MRWQQPKGTGKAFQIVYINNTDSNTAGKICLPSVFFTPFYLVSAHLDAAESQHLGVFSCSKWRWVFSPLAIAFGYLLLGNPAGFFHAGQAVSGGLRFSVPAGRSENRPFAPLKQGLPEYTVLIGCSQHRILAASLGDGRRSSNIKCFLVWISSLDSRPGNIPHRLLRRYKTQQTSCCLTKN